MNKTVTPGELFEDEFEHIGRSKLQIIYLAHGDAGGGHAAFAVGGDVDHILEHHFHAVQIAEFFIMRDAETIGAPIQRFRQVQQISVDLIG